MSRSDLIAPAGALAYFLVVYVTRQILIAPSASTLTAYIERVRSTYPVAGLLAQQLDMAAEAAAPAGRILRRRSDVRVLNGWRLAHGTEPILVREMPVAQAIPRLIILAQELVKSPVQGRVALGRRIQQALEAPDPEDDIALKALLGEALGQTYDARDDYFDAVVQEGKRTMWFTSIGLLAVASLAVAFKHSEFFLLGAVGGLFSRLAQVMRRRPEPTDYGVSWAPLMLGPVAGALAGWIGVLVLAVLAAAGLSPLEDQLNPNWDQQVVSTELALGFLLGFSERLLQRVLASGAERITPPPEAQPVPGGGPQPEAVTGRNP